MCTGGCWEVVLLCTTGVGHSRYSLAMTDETVDVSNRISVHPVDRLLNLRRSAKNTALVILNTPRREKSCEMEISLLLLYSQFTLQRILRGGKSVTDAISGTAAQCRAVVAAVCVACGRPRRFIHTNHSRSFHGPAGRSCPD